MNTKDLQSFERKRFVFLFNKKKIKKQSYSDLNRFIPIFSKVDSREFIFFFEEFVLESLLAWLSVDIFFNRMEKKRKEQGHEASGEKKKRKITKNETLEMEEKKIKAGPKKKEVTTEKKDKEKEIPQNTKPNDHQTNQIPQISSNWLKLKVSFVLLKN